MDEQNKTQKETEQPKETLYTRMGLPPEKEEALDNLIHKPFEPNGEWEHIDEYIKDLIELDLTPMELSYIVYGIGCVQTRQHLQPNPMQQMVQAMMQAGEE